MDAPHAHPRGSHAQASSDTNRSQHGGGSQGVAGGFGFGVGLALSPELAQRVRECQGVPSTKQASPGSLTYLRGSHANPAGNGSASPVDGSTSAHPTENEVYATSADTLGTPDTGDTLSGRERTLDESDALEKETSGLNGTGGKHEELLGGHRASEPLVDERDNPVDGTTAGYSEALLEGAVRQRDADAGVGLGLEVVEAPECWEEFDENSLPPPVCDGAHTSSQPADVHGLARRAEGMGGDSDKVGRAEDRIRNVLGPGNVDGADGTRSASDGPDEDASGTLQSLPVLLVELDRVCGFRVKGAEEAEAVGGKIRVALHESFRERSEELFEMGSGIHADTSTLTKELYRRRVSAECSSPASSLPATAAGGSSWAVVDYPREMDGQSVIAAWAELTAPAASSAVEAVRVALVGTNRNLGAKMRIRACFTSYRFHTFRVSIMEHIKSRLADSQAADIWKRDMLKQLEVVAAREREAMEAMEAGKRQEELDRWRARRREQLERLIEVRPMFERRRAMAEEKLGQASSIVKGTGESDPVAAAVVRSLDAKLESIDDLIARLEIEEGEEGRGFVPSDEEDDPFEFGDEDDFDDGGLEGEYEGRFGDGVGDCCNGDEPAAFTEHAPDAAQGSIVAGDASVDAPAESFNGSSALSETRSQACLEGGGEALESRNAAAVRTLSGQRAGETKKKTRKKAGIIRKLQAKRATGCTDEKAQRREASNGESVESETPKIGLLDAVAAMILGRYPQDPDDTSEQHFEKVAAMHERMKGAWVAEFGRLPEHI